MTIFLSFLQSEKQYAVPAYSFWEYYIKNGITEARHEWVECADADWAQGLVPTNEEKLKAWRDEIWEMTVSSLKKKPVDMFLSYLYPHMIDMDAILEIKKMGIPCVNFFCDHLRDFKKLPIAFSVFDLNWVPEYRALDLYKKAGYPFINLPMPMWVSPELRTIQQEKSDLTFIGSKDIQRQLLFEKIVALWPEVPLKIYGKTWDEDNSFQPLSAVTYTLKKKMQNQVDFIFKNGMLSYARKLTHARFLKNMSLSLKSKVKAAPDFAAYNQLIGSSLITLGVNRYPSFDFSLFKPDTYSRLRDIEAPMLGACYLTEWTTGIDELYDIGKEIETYREERELIEKAKELMADKGRRQSLKYHGQQKALAKHSIPASLNAIIKKI